MSKISLISLIILVSLSLSRFGQLFQFGQFDQFGGPWICAKIASESSASSFSWAVRGYEQKLPQKAEFEHFGGLAAE